MNVFILPNLLNMKKLKFFGTYLTKFVKKKFWSTESVLNQLFNLFVIPSSLLRGKVQSFDKAILDNINSLMLKKFAYSYNMYENYYFRCF